MSPQETQQSSVMINQKNQFIDLSQATEQALLLEELEWSETEVKESYYRLQHLEDDWNVPGMDAYDKL